MSPPILAIALVDLSAALGGISAFMGLLFSGSLVLPGREAQGAQLSSGERHSYTALVVHRPRRDERRCAAKYGEIWTQYRRQARFRILPFVY